MAQADENRQYGEQWGTRLPQDVNKEVSEFREENDLSKSETMRRLVKRGLDEQSAAQQWAHDMRHLADHMVAIGIVAFFATLMWPPGGLIPALTLGVTFATVASAAYILSHYIKENH